MRLAAVVAIPLLANMNLSIPAAPASEVDTIPRLRNETETSFTFDINDDVEDGIGSRSLSAGTCTGSFADPQIEPGGFLIYGLHVRCTGTGFLPLSARIKLQEEHLGFVYETVDEQYKNLNEGGFGFVEGQVVCAPSSSGHDYRIDAEIFAGPHKGVGLSKEVHLPCNVY